MSRGALLPSLVRDVLDAGPTGLGLLTATAGVGMMVGAMATSPLGRRLARGRTLLLALAIAAISLAGLGAVPNLAVALVLAGVVAMAVPRLPDDLGDAPPAPGTGADARPGARDVRRRAAGHDPAGQHPRGVTGACGRRRDDPASRTLC